MIQNQIVHFDAHLHRRPPTLSRRIAQPYRCQALDQLTRQLLFAPPSKRTAQVFHAERLHDEIDPQVNYPFDYIAFRITGFRSEQDPRTVLVGEAVICDLRLMIDALSRSTPIPCNDQDPVETPRQLAQRLNVSTKTLARWRKAGLRWRWVAVPGRGRKQLVFPRSAVDHFLNQNHQRVADAAAFSRIDPHTRQRLIRLARGLARRRGASLNQVAALLAKRLGRAVETIRLILQQHDRNHPQEAIFTSHTGPLTTRQHRLIARAHHWGIPVSKLAERFGRTPSTIYRAVRHSQAAHLRRTTISFVHAPIFDRPDADQVLLGPPLPRLPDQPPSVPETSSPQDKSAALQPPLAQLYHQPGFSPEVQKSLLTRYHFLKYRAAQRRDAVDPYEPRAGDLDAIAALLNQAATVRNLLVRANLANVLTVARKHLVTAEDRSPARLAQLLEAGNLVLYQAIENFNIAKDRPFDAYLTWRLMQRFTQIPPGRAHRQFDSHATLQRMQHDARPFGIDLLTIHL